MTFLGINLSSCFGWVQLLLFIGLKLARSRCTPAKKEKLLSLKKVKLVSESVSQHFSGDNVF